MGFVGNWVTVQIFFSFAFSIVLVALLQERETAVTWYLNPTNGGLWRRQN
jgi:hypothetical protein